MRPSLRWKLMWLSWGCLGLLVGCNSETTAPPPDARIDQRPIVDARVDAPQQLDLTRDQMPIDTTCVPIASCAGLCGPVKDKCGGELKCGGCGTGQVCDLATHICIKPQITCLDLAAQCGTTKNSCGKHIDCGDCGAGLECDPDSHTCVTCKSVTCADLGYECGTAWLGCGPSTTTTNCGTCPNGKKCNTSYNICEPACTPLSTSDICKNAKIASGVECGYISNGCGGIVNCGSCPTGQGCGVYGIANRCEAYLPPDECVVLGRNCGKITSVCGGTLDCGTCPTGQQCNSNGVCGPPCVPKVCADFAPKQCGAFPDSCNGTVSCPCSGGALCKTDGTCCTNTATCATGSCNTTLTNTCTGASIYCNTCTGTQYCDKTAKQCKPRKTCADFGPAGGSVEGNKCDDFPFYDRGDGVKIACPCTGPNGQTCINDSATAEGTCCTNVNSTCPAPGQKGSCNNTVTNSCTNVVTACVCPPGWHCDVDTCVQNDTCSKFGANGGDGDICSNDASSSFPDGAGGNLTCPCAAGYACLDTSGIPVSGGVTGNCKKKKVCADYSANGQAGDICSNAPSSSFPDGAGSKLQCGCGNTPLPMVCADGSNVIVSGDTTGVCKIKKTCADYSASGNVGDPCNGAAFYSDGFGGLFACPCKITGGFGNNTCVGATSAQAGTCQCTKTACTCANSGLTDGCGGTNSCPCGTGFTCNTSTATCCQAYSCSSLPPGYPAGACGTISNTCLGSSFSCSCPTTTKPNNKCVLSGTWGSCQCVPSTCSQLGVGTWPNDGCGNPITCSG
jgi:hypothetical protein